MTGLVHVPPSPLLHPGRGGMKAQGFERQVLLMVEGSKLM